VSVEYRTDAAINPAEAAALLVVGGFKRPLDEPTRVERMFSAAGLVVSAHEAGRLVGFVRVLTDRAYYGFVAEVVVAPDMQGSGVGRTMLERVRTELGPQVNLVLNASETGEGFYEHLGWERLTRGFKQARSR
jgi:GNAT superfamily N-acetyltransferase